MINEEMTDRELNIGLEASNTTVSELRNIIGKFIAQRNEKKQLPETNQSINKITKPQTLKSGKQTLEQLQRQRGKLTPVQLTDPHLRSLKKAMNKEKIDFAITKDGKGKYLLHFKTNDTLKLKKALNKYIKHLKKRDIAKPSIGKALYEAKILAKTLSQNRNKAKNKSWGAR